MKLIYIVNARIPTEKAHGVQIMKMCEAFAAAGIEVVGINDLGSVETNAHLLKYDSIHGRFPGEITTGENWIDAGRVDQAGLQPATRPRVPHRGRGYSSALLRPR